MSLAKDKEDIRSMRRARIKGPGWERAWRADGTAHGSFGMARVPREGGDCCGSAQNGEESPQCFVCQVKECELESEDQRFTEGCKGQFTFYVVR